MKGDGAAVRKFRDKRAFDHCAADYAVGRPGYPDAVMDALSARVGRAAGRLALDVGAGTGIFSQRLRRAGWRVVMVDSSAAMLGRAAGDAGGAAVRVCAMAERLPMGDSSVSLVSAAQAFHWFNPPYALAEFGRVLHSGGWLVLVWNNRDAERSGFVRDYEAVIRRFVPTYRREYRKQDWAAKIEATGLLGDVDVRRLDHEWEVSAETFLRYTRSVSYVRNVLARERVGAFERAVEGVFRAHFGNGLGCVAMTTELWTARRLS